MTRPRAWRTSLLLLVTTLLAACSVPTKAPPPEPYKGPLVLWVSTGLGGLPVLQPTAESLKNLAQAFQKDHPGYQLQVVEFQTPAALEEALANAKERPDVAFGRPLAEVVDHLARIQLPAAVEADVAATAFAAFRRPDGGTGGVPALLDARALAVNSRAFTGAGQVPAEWDHAQFRAALQRLKEAGQAGFGFYHRPEQMDWWALAGTTAAGVDEAGLKRLVDWMHADGFGHADIAKLSPGETWAAFAAGKFALMPVAGWALPLLQADPYKVDLQVAPLPGAHKTAGFAYGALVFASQDPKRVEAATQLAVALTEPPHLVKVARLTGLMPARKSAGNPFEGDKALTALYHLSQSHAPFPAGITYRQNEKIVWREFQLVLLGAVAPETGLQNVRRTLETK